MNKYQYWLIKQAANNWMSNADSPDNLLSEDSDMYKNLEKVDDNSFYDAAKEGPIYQDVSDLYQNPSKYGIPEEVAMAEREHHDNDVARWRQEYQDATNDLYRTEAGPLSDATAISPTMVSALSGAGGYDLPSGPTISALVNDAYSNPDMPEPYAGASTYLHPDSVTSDKFINGYKRMQGAPIGLRRQYEGLMDTRNQLMMRRSAESDPAIIDRLTRAIKRVEGNLTMFIDQLDR